MRTADDTDSNAVGTVLSVGIALSDSGVAPNVAESSGLWESIVFAAEVPLKP